MGLESANMSPVNKSLSPKTNLSPTTAGQSFAQSRNEVSPLLLRVKTSNTVTDRY